jgi:uncharacterized protein YjiS (DUF1127 family)
MSCTASVPDQMGRAASLGAGIHALGRRIAAALAVRAERRALMALDESALKDMGFNKGQAQHEYGRSFWDVPVDRLRW